MTSSDLAGNDLFHIQKGVGQSIVFVHGIPTDYRAWNSQVDEFANKYQAFSYSRRYAYPNKRQGDLKDSTIENNASDLVNLIKKLETSPVHLVGHSYGGFIAAYCASRNPELLRTLVLVDPAASTLLIKDPKNPIQFLSLLFTKPATAISAANFTTKSLNPSMSAIHRGDLDTALRLNVEGIMNRKGAFEQFPESVRAMMKDNARTVAELDTKLPNFTKEDARRILVPTLLVNGVNSPKFFHTIVDELGKAIPRSETVRISNSAHFPHVENPEEFNKQLLNFLAKNG